MPTVRIALTRSPHTQRARQIIREELSRGYERELYPRAEAEHAAEVVDWADPPRFYMTTETQGARLFVWRLRVHKEEPGGLHFWWVNFGTGVEGPLHRTYPIDPVNAPMLVFTIPYQPLTIPPNGLLYNPNATPSLQRRHHIDHPGMRPRRISERIFQRFMQRGDQYSFYQVTDRAFRRAFARVSAGP